MEQHDNSAIIHCADGTSYKGDIVVGADGAYSGVRQAMYKSLAEEGKLPSSDAVQLNKGFICMVGTTRPLDPARYPGIDDTIANCNQIIGDNKYCVRKKLLYIVDN
jgi:2-polyprenyl-6-methoxyphenol hydroxylase-like FAD-dependent oxidoreductase